MAAQQNQPIENPQNIVNAFVEYYFNPNENRVTLVQFYENMKESCGRYPKKRDFFGDFEKKKLPFLCEGNERKIIHRENFPIKVDKVDTPKIQFGEVINVVVTGNLIAFNIVEKHFTQRFILVPCKCNTGYLVLNTVFKFTKEVYLTASPGNFKIIILPDEGDVSVGEKVIKSPKIIKKAGKFSMENKSPNIVGKKGEEVAFAILKEEYGKENVKWVNQQNESGRPCDIIIRDNENKERFVEVKSTTDPEKFCYFILSPAQLEEFCNNQNSNSIARVFLGSSEVKLILLEGLFGHGTQSFLDVRLRNETTYKTVKYPLRYLQRR